MNIRTKLAPLVILSLLSACSRNPEVTKRRYLESGVQYAKQHKYEEARIQFMKALKVDPRLGDAYYQMGLADLELQKWNDALANFQQTLELAPDRVDAQLQLGQLFAAAHQFDQAHEATAAALKKDPRSADAYRLLGHICVGEQNLTAAEEAFTKVTKLDSTSASSYEDLALVEVGLHHLPQAEQNLRKAVEVDPTFAQGYVNLSSLYRFQEQGVEAEQVLDHGISRNPDEATLYLARANILFSEGSKDAAENLLQRLRDRKKGSVDATLAIAGFYFDHGLKDQSIAEYQRGLTAYPKNVQLRNQLVESYLGSNKLQEAGELNKSVLKDKPEDDVARVQSGRILLVGGHVQDAIAALRRQVTDTPDSYQAHYFLGLAYWQNGSLGEARTELQEALRISPTRVPLVQSMAKLQLAQGNFPEAKEFAEKGVQLMPGDPEGRLLLGDVRLSAGDPAGAREEFELAARLLPKDATPHLKLAAAYRREKKWADTQRELDAALMLNPHSTEALGAIVDLLISRNERDKAISKVQAILAKDPNDANAHFVLGSVLLGEKAYQEAKTELQRTTELDPKLTAAYLRRAKLEEDQGNVDDAIAGYQKALALQPNFPPLLTLLGNIYLENKGDLRTARIYYERAVAVDANFAPAIANLAYVEAEQGGDLNVALGLAQKAKQMLPDAESISDVLGWVEYLKGSYQETIPMFKECVRKDPARGVYRYHLGMALLAAGEKQEGKSQLESALQLKLSADNAEQARGKLAQMQAN